MLYICTVQGTKTRNDRAPSKKSLPRWHAGRASSPKVSRKDLKDHLANRLKEYERRPPADVEGWVVATFTNALRKAHIVMRSRRTPVPRTAAGAVRYAGSARNSATTQHGWRMALPRGPAAALASRCRLSDRADSHDSRLKSE